jgi:hypothetical protein
MAKTTKYFIKFPTGFLQSKHWSESRKYSKAEALIYLLTEPNASIGKLAKVFQWSKSTVHSFIREMVSLGYLEEVAERLPNGLPNDCRTTNVVNISELQDSAERLPNGLPNDCRTHLNKRIDNTPLILSTTNVVSNICPPIGENTHTQKTADDNFSLFQKWISENAPRVAKMKEPFTQEEFYRLKQDFDSQFICELLKAMHNYEPLLTKNRNANLTFRKWAKKQQNDESSKPTFSASKTAKPSNEALLRAVANGISRARTEQ